MAKSLTQIMGRRIVNYGSAPNGTVVVEKMWMKIKKSARSPLWNYTLASPSPYTFERAGCAMQVKRGGFCPPPYSDHSHFLGGGKPWYHLPPFFLSSNNSSVIPAEPSSSEELWWLTLLEIRRDHGIDMVSPIVAAIQSKKKKKKK